jgi:hypothetical protein
MTNTTTTITPSTDALIEALRAFIAAQGRVVRDGLIAAAAGDDARARECLASVEAQASAVVESVRFDGAHFGWDDGLSQGISDPVPAIDLLGQYVDRDDIGFAPDQVAALVELVRGAA